MVKGRVSEQAERVSDKVETTSLREYIEKRSEDGSKEVGSFSLRNAGVA